MVKSSLFTLTFASTVAFAAAAQAECQVEGSGEVNVVMNFFPVLELLDKQMQTCAGDTLKIANKLTTDHRSELKNLAEASSSPFDAAHVANSSITPLQAKGQLVALNDLVEKYRDKYQIEDQMLITFGDQVMAVAFMANAQHLFYRRDIFDELGIAAPQTWDEVVAAAEKIKAAGVIEYPYGAAYKTGWELGNDFVDIYLAYGGELFDPATGEAAFDNEAGLKTLELMKTLVGYMSPNALAIDFGGVKQQMQQGQVAMAFLWGDQAASMDDPKESKVVEKVAFAPAPSVEVGGPPATAFWWDGFVIPSNLDGDPDLTFQVLMEALKPDVVSENNDATLWLRSNYQPGKYAEAIIASVEGGAPPYPMLPQAGLAHSAIGENIDDFLAGKESAEQSLADAAAEYRKAAVDAGYLN
jgi:ABC-type glycerol-3-phosphate transport system substrate-binding protein